MTATTPFSTSAAILDCKCGIAFSIHGAGKIAPLGHHRKGVLALVVPWHLPNPSQDTKGCSIARPGQDGHGIASSCWIPHHIPPAKAVIGRHRLRVPVHQIFQLQSHHLLRQPLPLLRRVRMWPGLGGAAHVASTSAVLVLPGPADPPTGLSVTHLLYRLAQHIDPQHNTPGPAAYLPVQRSSASFSA